jgi:uncharacterized protein (TIGR03083 family)
MTTENSARTIAGPSFAAPDNERYLVLLQRDADRMLDVAAGGLDLDVPCCPGWTVADVVAHTAEVYQDKIACMRLGRAPEDDEYQQRPPEGVDLLTWLRDSYAALRAELVERGPGAASYTWWPGDQTVGFWYRRMAQETAVHRVDVEAAHDAVTPIDDQLAVDGIDEVLERFIGGDWSEYPPEAWEGVSPDAGAGRTVAVRSGDQAWRVTMSPDRMDLARQAGPADATITGEPSEVLLALWGRRPLSAVRIEGDRSVVDAFRDRLRLATQ